MENGFQGKEDQKIPEMTDDFINSVSERYIELYENITQQKFIKSDISNIYQRVESNIINYAPRVRITVK